jgi:hypothetical protein
MIIALTVRLGDAVVLGESSHPLTADGSISHVYIVFHPDDPEADHRGAAFMEAMKEILCRGRIKIIINKDVHLESEFVYEVPTLAPDWATRATISKPPDPNLPRPLAPWRVRRGDTMKFRVELVGDAPKKPVVMKAVFDIEEAPAPALN